MRYEFGRNWAEFIEKNFNDERIDAAKQHLLGFMKLDSLRGKTMIDIGCGSGLHSLAAHRAGAERILSFDYDPNSVATTLKLREFAGNPSNWEVKQGSVLDRAYMETLGKFDLTYSWGVLHHTGEMWKAIDNARVTMKDDGMFYIALYTTDVYVDPTADYWMDIKRKYNQSGALTRRIMEWQYALRFTILPALRSGKNPIPMLLGWRQPRGMTYWTDVKDWLGGYPMEFAGIAETESFCADKLGLEVLNVYAGEANTEYLFRPKQSRNYWDEVMAAHPLHELKGPFPNHGGKAWRAHLPELKSSADSSAEPKKSRLMLYENEIPVGFTHQPHAHIVAHGGGRYSHWGDDLIFSTSDGTDPNTNGRVYSYRNDFAF